MSTNRENVIWPAKDGTWNIGFFSFYDTKSWDDEDYDHEWDVDYDYDSFWWASSGHLTREAAYASYTRQHSNPGGNGGFDTRTGEDRKEAERLDAILWAFQNPREHAEKVAAENKKAVASHNRAQRKKGKEFMEKAGDGRYVRVDYITNQFHVQRYDHAYLATEGDWLGFRNNGKFVRVYNKATGTLHSKILTVEGAVQQRSYGFGRW